MSLVPLPYVNLDNKVNIPRQKSFLSSYKLSSAISTLKISTPSFKTLSLKFQECKYLVKLFADRKSRPSVKSFVFMTGYLSSLDSSSFVLFFKKLHMYSQYIWDYIPPTQKLFLSIMYITNYPISSHIRLQYLFSGFVIFLHGVKKMLSATQKSQIHKNGVNLLLAKL